jgi:hypothetical protein
MEARAADSFVCRHLVDQPSLIVPTDTRTSLRVFRNYRLRCLLVAFQRRFRLLELPLPEIRFEFDRNASNARILQSGMPHQARFQEFHRLSTRRHRVLSRQSEGLKRKNPSFRKSVELNGTFIKSAFLGRNSRILVRFARSRLNSTQSIALRSQLIRRTRSAKP